MAYVKAHLTFGEDLVREGGFYTHQINMVLSKKSDNELKARIVLVKSENYKVAEAIINLPIKEVSNLLEQLEIEGGCLDLLQATDPNYKGEIDPPTIKGLHGKIIKPIESIDKSTPIKLPSSFNKGSKL